MKKDYFWSENNASKFYQKEEFYFNILNLISGNNVGAEGIKYLGSALDKMQNMTSLNLNLWYFIINLNNN